LESYCLQGRICSSTSRDCRRVLSPWLQREGPM